MKSIAKTKPLESAKMEQETTKNDGVAPRCGAIGKRTGKPCPLPAMPGRSRCKWHGGASTGPKTEEGRRASSQNGKKGGRPRKVVQPVNLTTGAHLPAKPLLDVAIKVELTAMVPPVVVDQPKVRCVDCSNFSAGHTCIPAGRGLLGPHADQSLMAGDWRSCVLYEEFKWPTE